MFVLFSRVYQIFFARVPSNRILPLSSTLGTHLLSPPVTSSVERSSASAELLLYADGGTTPQAMIASVASLSEPAGAAVGVLSEEKVDGFRGRWMSR